MRTLTYAEITGYRPLKLDLHVPDGVPGAPLAVWIHGGGFRSGDRAELPWTYPAGGVWDTLGAAGIACASVDYRFSGEAVWPAQRDDIAAALAFLREHAPAYGVDATRIGTWGESAGGHLALMAALTDPGVRCAVGWYPLTDILALGREGPDTSEAGLLGGLPTTRPALAADASPTSHVTASAPPCLLMHGGSDWLVPDAQSRLMHDRLTAAGASSTLRIVADADHCFDGHPDVARLLDEAVGFLRAHL